MAAASENVACENIVDNKEKMCTIEATVVTGFEQVVKAECRKKLEINAHTERGRIFFDIALHRVNDVLKLQGIDNIFVVLKKYDSLQFSKSCEDDLAKLKGLIPDLDWKTGLEAWRLLNRANDPTFPSVKRMLCGYLSKKEQTSDGDSNDDKSKGDDSNDDGAATYIPKFRATCNRAGDSKTHSFSSMQAAAAVGGAINDIYGWKVDMKSFDLNVIVNVDFRRVYFCIALTSESLHRRHLVEFGPTSLRLTIAFNLLQIAKVQPGDVVCDPMCGGGSIPIEACVNWPSVMVLCGDHHDMAIPRCYENIKHLNEKQRSKQSGEACVDLLQWDACHFPLRNESVDIFVTDLPFGKRMGSRTDNRILYPQLLREMTRLSRPNSSRAVLLTQDKRSITKAIWDHSTWWRQGFTGNCNIGGLNASFYLIHRTDRLWDQ